MTRDRAFFPSALSLLGACALALTTACLGGGSSPSNVAGTGRAEFFLEIVEWGRLVDVLDSNGVLVERDVVVRESLTSLDPRYTLGTNPLTQSETLTIEAPVGSSDFEAWFQEARESLASVSAKGLNSAGPFTRVARNGAIRLQFSEYVDPETVDRQTIQVLAGDPPTQNLEVRYVVKKEIGQDGKPKGVVILDPTVSAFDQAELGIPENGLGFPASPDQESPNLEIRIPTEVDFLFGQNRVLTNEAGNHEIEPTQSDPVELSAGLDPVVVRAMRTGNEADPYNGYMRDEEPPKLITEQPATILEVASVPGNPSLRTLTYFLDRENCREITPKEGDVFEVPSGLLLVSKVVSASNPLAYKVTAALLEGDLAAGSTNVAAFVTTAYDSADQPLQACWLEFSPEPEFAFPARGIDPFSSVTLHFNEAIDPATVQSMETMVLVSYDNTDSDPKAAPFDPDSETVGDYIDRQIGYEFIDVEGGGTGTGSGRIKFGPITASGDSQSFTLTPSFGFTDSHSEGTDLRFALALRDGAEGVRDLAGNAGDWSGFVAGSPDQDEQITKGNFSPWPTDRYFALRFNSTDENLDGAPEYAGQFTFSTGTLRGRQLIRYTRQADPSNFYIGSRIAFSQGIMTPLTPAGAVLQQVWGYHHLGLGFQQSEYNLDIEGLAWAPFGGVIFDDIFPRFSVALHHSDRYPDDYIDPTSGYPDWDNSGLRRDAKFKKNWLGDDADPDIEEQIMVDGEYQLNAINLFTALSGTTMYPFGEFTGSYTWRDTGFPQDITGGKNGNGVPIDQVSLGNKIWEDGEWPSIAAPLLTTYRCYPRGAFFGSNGFQVQIMVGSSALPAFRVFSAGGRDAGGTWHFVVPDDPNNNGTKPSGGYNTVTGETTKAYGPELYWGQCEFVIRVSRVFTHWFEFGGTLDQISPFTMEPAAQQQPEGTEILIEFRGTTQIDQSDCDRDNDGFLSEFTPLTSASVFDAYGDFHTHDPAPELNVTEFACGDVTLPGDWTTDPNDLVGQGAQYFQLRFTFIANTEQDFEPWLDALGFAWNVTATP